MEQKKIHSPFEVPSLLYKSLFVAALSFLFWFVYSNNDIAYFIISLALAVFGCAASWLITKTRESGEMYLPKLAVIVSVIIKLVFLGLFIWYNIPRLSKIAVNGYEKLKFAAVIFAIAFVVLCLIGIVKTIRALACAKGGLKTQMTTLDFNW